MCQPNVNVRITFLQSSTLFRISKANSKLNADRLVLSWSCSGDPISAFLSRLELQAGHYTIWHLEELWVPKLLSTCLHGQMFNHWAISPGWEKMVLTDICFYPLILCTIKILHICVLSTPVTQSMSFRLKRYPLGPGRRLNGKGHLLPMLLTRAQSLEPMW